MKELFGNCADNPFGSVNELTKVIDKAKKIRRRVFLAECNVSPGIVQDMRRFPNDYEFYRYKDILFYTWSAIEHFYK